jgi:hypothetical protein
LQQNSCKTHGLLQNKESLEITQGLKDTGFASFWLVLFVEWHSESRGFYSFFFE